MVLPPRRWPTPLVKGIDFFPLTVEYEERMYAGGRIPGSFFRREGRPSTEAILTARLTDRPLRPLFNQEMRNEVQVIMFSISADQDNPLDILAINAASAALTISDIPWAARLAQCASGASMGSSLSTPPSPRLMNPTLDLRWPAPATHPDGRMRCKRDPGRCDGRSAVVRSPIHPAVDRPAGTAGRRSWQAQARSNALPDCARADAAC
jgi:hypothetical protein